MFIAVIVLLGAAKWAEMGIFRKWVQEGELNKLSDNTTDSYLEYLKTIPDVIKKAFDEDPATATAGTSTESDADAAAAAAATVAETTAPAEVSP